MKALTNPYQRTNKSIIQTINRTNFKKIANYYLHTFGKVQRINSFTARSVIFTAVANRKMLFGLTGCKHQSSYIRKGKLYTTYTFDVQGLQNWVNTVHFFERFPDSKKKMKFPDVQLKHSEPIHRID